jgi:hypothetical protein
MKSRILEWGDPPFQFASDTYSVDALGDSELHAYLHNTMARQVFHIGVRHAFCEGILK